MMVVIAVLAVLAETLWLTSRMTTARYVGPVSCSAFRLAQMWVETKRNNEQLREEVEVAKEELSNTKKKLEEALVVCT